VEKISVVIPTYNRAKYLPESIGSVFNQKHRPLELVIVDDASTDETTSILSEIMKTKPTDIEMKIITHEQNLGCGAALNHGFMLASGDYITYLGSDDMYLNSYSLTCQMRGMSVKNADWSCYRDSHIGPTPKESKIVKPSFIPRLRVFDNFIMRHPYLRLMMLMWRNPINSSTVMVERNVYITFGGWFDFTRNADCDGLLLMLYSYRKLNCLFLEGAPIFYRVHPGMVSNDLTAMCKGKDATRNYILDLMHKEKSWFYIPTLLFRKLVKI